MSITQQDTATASQPSGATALRATFEVTTLPVVDVDRAKEFYARLGWRLDIDFEPTPDTRAVQFTPPGSLDAREQGSTPEQAAEAAGRYMADVKLVVVASD